MKTNKLYISALIIISLTVSFAFSTTELVFSDDFESSTGWVRNYSGTDDASTGLWERENPEETQYGITMQLGTTVSGVKCLVTGPWAGYYPGDYDIDDGKTSARSPDIVIPDISEDETITLSFSYYFAHYSNSSSEDYLRVKVVSSTTTQTVLEELGSADEDEAVWETFSADLNDFAGQKVNIFIEAADEGVGSLVEAGVEDVLIERSTTPGPQDECWEMVGNDIKNRNTGGSVYIGDKSSANYFEFNPAEGLFDIYGKYGHIGFDAGGTFTVGDFIEFGKSGLFVDYIQAKNADHLIFDSDVEMGAERNLTANDITALGDIACTGEGSKLSASVLEVSQAKVHGKLFAKEVTVTLDIFPDYIFSESYPLKSLAEIEEHIKRHGTLPGMPSEKEVKENGVNLGGLQIKLLEKIEEMTLHMIKMQKRIDELEAKQSEKK